LAFPRDKRLILTNTDTNKAVRKFHKVDVIMNTIRYIVFSLFLLSLSNNANCEPDGIKHIVLCWLNNVNDAASLNAVISASRELKTIAGVNSIVVGQAVTSDRDIVDDSFDVGMVMSFKSQQKLDQYLVDEEHIRRVKEVFAPQCGKILVYDIAH
jgi:hypothetical protein